MLTQADFAGSWQLSRLIDDHAAGQAGTFAGTAVFTHVAEAALAYHETGTMTLGGGPGLKATRRYHWAFSGGRVDVAFDDGRAFHSFVPAGHAAGTDHPCGDDFYTVRYDFTAWPAWSAVWTVTGPRKNYVSTSNYARIAPRVAI